MSRQIQPNTDCHSNYPNNNNFTQQPNTDWYRNCHWNHEIELVGGKVMTPYKAWHFDSWTTDWHDKRITASSSNQSYSIEWLQLEIKHYWLDSIIHRSAGSHRLVWLCWSSILSTASQWIFNNNGRRNDIWLMESHGGRLLQPNTELGTFDQIRHDKLQRINIYFKEWNSIGNFFFFF